MFVGGGKFLVMIDDTTGKVVANAPICGGTAATFFDPGTKMVFAACRDSTITVAHEDGPVGTHRLYTAAPNYAPVDPAAPAPPTGGGRGRGGPQPIPETFHVLVYGMK